MPKKRSTTWAVVRDKAPPMPWDSDPDARIFPSLARLKGSAYALRMWNYLCALSEFETEGDVRHFFATIERVSGRQELADFLDVYKLCRITAGGMERQRVAHLGRSPDRVEDRRHDLTGDAPAGPSDEGD